MYPKLFGRNGMLGGTINPLVTGGMVGHAVASGQNSLGGTLGETAGGLYGYGLAQNFGRRLKRGIGAKTIGKRLARGLLGLPLSLIGGMTAGWFGGKTGDRLIPLKFRPEGQKTAAFSNGSNHRALRGKTQLCEDSMDKMAFAVRNAEVRGALAAFVDADLIKCASTSDFDALAERVASDIPEMDYTLDDIAAATQLALSGENREKTAAEHSSDVKAALGELMLMKVAGEIDRATFNREAAPLVKEAISLEGAGQALRGLGKRLYTMDSEEAARHLGGAAGKARDYLLGGFKLEGIRDAAAKRKALAAFRENIRKVTGTRAARRVRQDALGTVGTKAERSRTRGLGQAAAAYGLAGAGLGGAAYGAKKLYDRFGRGREEDIAAALGE